jgi:hypothetical protein
MGGYYKGMAKRSMLLTNYQLGGGLLTTDLHFFFLSQIVKTAAWINRLRR